MTPTSRSLAVLREMGYVAQVVEHWNHFAKIRQDLFGCIDILAMHPEHGLLAIQATDGTSASKRVAKCSAEARCEIFIRAGGRFEVWSWGRRGAAGKRKLWTLRRQQAMLVRGAIEFVELTIL